MSTEWRRNARTHKEGGRDTCDKADHLARGQPLRTIDSPLTHPYKACWLGVRGRQLLGLPPPSSPDLRLSEYNAM